MYQLVEWLVFHLPQEGYREAWDTTWISWSKWGLCLSISFWPLGVASVRLGRWGHTWVVD